MNKHEKKGDHLSGWSTVSERDQSHMDIMFKKLDLKPCIVISSAWEPPVLAIRFFTVD